MLGRLISFVKFNSSSSKCNFLLLLYIFREKKLSSNNKICVKFARTHDEIKFIALTKIKKSEIKMKNYLGGLNFYFIFYKLAIIIHIGQIFIASFYAIF